MSLRASKHVRGDQHKLQSKAARKPCKLFSLPPIPGRNWFLADACAMLAITEALLEQRPNPSSSFSPAELVVRCQHNLEGLRRLVHVALVRVDESS